MEDFKILNRDSSCLKSVGKWVVDRFEVSVISVTDRVL